MQVLVALLNDLIRNIESDLTEEEYIEKKRAIATLMYDIYENQLKPIWAENPTLLPQKMGGQHHINESDLSEIIKKLHETITKN